MTPVACRLCGGEAEPCERLAPLPFATCGECSFTMRADAEVHEHYEQGDYAAGWEKTYCVQELDRRRDAGVRLDWLDAIRPGSAGSGTELLDVGAAGGEFVAEAVGRGYRAWGVEPSPPFAARARELLGVDVRDGTLEELELPPASLDVVTLWHVLEHIPQPVDELRRIEAALRPGGAVAIEVPNYGSAVAQRTGPAWTSLQPDVHVSQFASETLALALRRSGFEGVRIETVPITPYLPPRQRVGPRHLAARLKATVWLRSPRAVHPHGHELLRALGSKRGAA